jgi:hypothetical protein
MDLAQRADNIAMEAVKDNAGTGLRALSSAARSQRMTDCLDELTRLLGSELDNDGILRFAAQAAIRASMYKTATLAYEDSVDDFLTALAERPTRGRSIAKIIKDAQQKLLRRGQPLIAELVNGAQATAVSLKASDSAYRGKTKTANLEVFAYKLYEAKQWLSRAEAARRLWPLVKAEGLRSGKPLSEITGPATLYGWLSKSDKRTSSAS